MLTDQKQDNLPHANNPNNNQPSSMPMIDESVLYQEDREKDLSEEKKIEQYQKFIDEYKKKLAALKGRTETEVGNYDVEDVGAEAVKLTLDDNSTLHNKS